MPTPSLKHVTINLKNETTFRRARFAVTNRQGFIFEQYVARGAKDSSEEALRREDSSPACLKVDSYII